MTITEMSITGGIMILAVTVVHALGVNKLPKRVFIAMWEIIFLRLLLPINIPMPILPAVQTPAPVISAYHDSYIPSPSVPTFVPQTPDTSAVTETVSKLVSPEAATLPKISFTSVWLVGLALIALFFALTYVRSIRRFKTSLPVENDCVGDWLCMLKTRRKISVRYTDRVSSPLTYGIIRPVILLPKNTDFSDRKHLSYILEHEYAHIRHFDALKKLIAAALLCVHWFNPLVWVMYLLYNRDMELWCDECVVREFGAESRSAYARTLITMEELKCGSTPLLSHFRKNSVEERIVSIMKFKKTTIVSIIVAALLIAAITITIIATSVTPVPREPDDADPSVSDGVENDETVVPKDDSSINNDAYDADNTSALTSNDDFPSPSLALNTLYAGGSLHPISDIYKDGGIYTDNDIFCQNFLESDGTYHESYYATHFEKGEKAAVVIDLGEININDSEQLSEYVNSLKVYSVVEFRHVKESHVLTSRKIIWSPLGAPNGKTYLVSMFEAPTDGDYTFNSVNKGDNNIPFSGHWVQLQNSDDPDGIINCRLSDEEKAQIALIGNEAEAIELYSSIASFAHSDSLFDESNVTETASETIDFEMFVYMDSDGKKFYALDGSFADKGSMLWAIPVADEDIYLTEYARFTMTADEFNSWVDKEIERIRNSVGDICYDRTLGKVYIRDDYDHAKGSPDDQTMLGQMIEAHDLLRKTITESNVTIRITYCDIPATVDFAPGDIVTLTKIYNIPYWPENGGVVYLEPGTYSIWWKYSFLDKNIDMRQTIELGCYLDGEKIVIYDEPMDTVTYSFVPGPYTMQFNIVEEGDYQFYLKNLGNTTLPLDYLYIVKDPNDAEWALPVTR